MKNHISWDSSELIEGKISFCSSFNKYIVAISDIYIFLVCLSAAIDRPVDGIPGCLQLPRATAFLSFVLTQLFVQLCNKMILLEQKRLYIYNLSIYYNIYVFV